VAVDLLRQLAHDGQLGETLGVVAGIDRPSDLVQVSTDRTKLVARFSQRLKLHLAELLATTKAAAYKGGDPAREGEAIGCRNALGQAVLALRQPDLNPAGAAIDKAG
jgi:hypothetical protein